MTDCELLELAAKAAGYSLSAVSDMIWSDAAVEYIPWNPLTDDGDALRLAVKLELEIRAFNGRAHAGKQNKFWCTEHWFPDGDVNAATRRAIVLAAAEIGKQIKGGQHDK